jgi:hypothetical protein
MDKSENAHLQIFYSSFNAFGLHLVIKCGHLRKLNKQWEAKTWFRCLEFKTCENVNLVYGTSLSIMGGRAHSSLPRRLYLSNFAIFTSPNPT